MHGHDLPKMNAQSRTRILKQAYTAFALLLAVTSTVASARPARHSSPSSPASHSSSDQTITLYTTGVAPPETTAPSARARHPVFTTNQGPVAHHGSWLRALTRPDALRPGAVTVIDEQLRGRKEEFGLPLEGRLQGVLVTSSADSSSHMVAVKASFAGDGADDSLRFFGVRRDDQESHVAVVGGTGRYSDATGFAVVRVAGVPEIGGNSSSSRALSFSVHLK